MHDVELFFSRKQNPPLIPSEMKGIFYAGAAYYKITFS